MRKLDYKYFIIELNYCRFKYNKNFTILNFISRYYNKKKKYNKKSIYYLQILILKSLK